MDENENGGGIYDEEDFKKPEEREEEAKNPSAKEQTADELKKEIADYQNQLEDINELLKTVKDVKSEEYAEIQTLKKQITDAIAYSTDLIKLKESDQGKIKISMRTLTEKDKGKVCEAFFDSEQKWFAETQTAEIDWLGYTEKTNVPAKFIKIAKHPEASQLEEGYFCESLYEKDGCWYPCIIEKKLGEFYVVRFKKFANRETVPLEYIRLKPEDAKKNREKEKEGLENFVAPEKLKLKPTDTTEQRLAKRKKVKALKQNHKRKIIDKNNREKQETWLNFQHKASRNKRGHYQATKSKNSIFKTPDTFDGKVGVVGSGKGVSSEYQRKKHTEHHGSIATPDDLGYRPSKRSKYRE
ncbi:unnamed protein product [Moneuplotes crassus]|uniref:Tudor domain-containing protein n=1 Tax=Euplotes crassus TaxID=5936 RepID=A0AAD1XIC2_EUPCR|nr:unnamed protein product [Moneuplotes crassus]